MDNKKMYQRAIAKSIVNDTGDLLRLIAAYRIVGNDINYKDLLAVITELLLTNKAFAEDFTKFLIKKKRIVDYNSIAIKRKREYRNFTGIEEAIAAVAQLGTAGIRLIGKGKDRDLSYAELENQNDRLDFQQQQAILNMIGQEEQTRVAKAKQENTLIMVAIIGMVGFTGIIIFAKKM